MRVLALLLALTLGMSSPAAAQGVSGPTPILTIEPERLFTDSAFGERIAADVLVAETELSLENRRIEEALTIEERNLTEQRPTMDPEVFRAEANAFDEKVQSIRQAQDAKERALVRISEEGQRAFLQAASPILGALMRERGATVIMDRRVVFGSLDVIDVTDEAIARIDALIGDGGLVPEEIAPELDPVDDPVVEETPIPESPEN